MKSVGIDILSIRIAISGALLFFISAIFFKYKAPEKIRNYANAEEYIDYCTSQNVNPYEEFAYLNSLSEEKIRNEFVDNMHLYPISDGLSRARETTIKTCAEIEYTRLNENQKYMRWFFTIAFSLSVLLMNYPNLARLYSVFN